MQAKITQLVSYPIKSCAGISHKQIDINAMGLANDRQMMVVQNDGTFLSQRKYPKMALIKPEIIAQDVLKLSAPGMADITVEHQGGNNIKAVTVWKDTVKAIELHPQFNDWLSEYLSQSVQLVQYGTVSHRAIDKAFAKNNETVAFADGYPILLTHEASLQHLNQHLTTPVPMSRFRPNIVVSSTASAWQELNWQQLKAEHFTLDLVKPCARCIMTGIDQKQGQQTGQEVFKTLQKKFAHDGKVIFGVNGIPMVASKKRLSVGMELQIIHKPNIE